MMKNALLFAALFATAFALASAGTELETIRGVSDGHARGTNDVVTFVRALYQNCTDGNKDYLSIKFLQGPKQFITSKTVTRDAARAGLAKVSSNNVVYFSARTNYLDNILEKNLAAGIKQVVIVAAGYDSRAYRYAAKGVKFFEVDLPDVVASKEDSVKSLNLPTDNVTYLAADLSKTGLDEVLRADNTFEASLPTVYFVEGLVYYLPQPAVNALYTSIGKIAAPGSVIAYDFGNLCLPEKNCPDLPWWQMEAFQAALKIKGEPYLSGMHLEDQKTWLAGFGMELVEGISFKDAKTKLGVETWTDSPVMGQLNFVQAVVPRRYHQEYLF